ncbi:MAG TPA: glycine oxidase ThiO [Candidatus Elarobacter sp.]|jgi:glycine oxidase|nr:glycine oxidase ThiO [Candidatus Elarobacter sp.]
MSDVAVVGAGLIGLGIAYELAKRGASVAVYDRAEPARAASWAGAGMLAPFSEEMRDEAMLALCRTSLEIYPEFVDELRERTGVDARFRRDGTLHVALDDARMAALVAHAETFRANGGEVVVLDRAETLAREPMLAKGLTGALFVANEAQVDNRRLGRALVAACESLGVRFECTDEVALECDERRVRGLRTAHGFTSTEIVINAAGAWAGRLASVPEFMRVGVYPVTGEMLALAVPRGAMRALVWLGHRYLVPRDDGRLLVGATVDERGFDARVTAAGVHDLLGAALAVAPSLGSFAVVETWAGLRPASDDGRPYIGPTALEGYFIASGHYRNGILLTPITAQYIADLFEGGPPRGRAAKALAPFAPERMFAQPELWGTKPAHDDGTGAAPGAANYTA